MSQKTIVNNRRARHDYQVLDTVEAGIALQGTEVKSLRNAGSMTLKDSYADIRNGEMFLIGSYIKPYEQGNIYNHPPERERKLLLHKREILRIKQRIEEKGLTLIPLHIYFNHGLVKVELGVCRGKRTHDKRATLKEKESAREVDRAVKDFGQR